MSSSSIRRPIAVVLLTVSLSAGCASTGDLTLRTTGQHVPVTIGKTPTDIAVIPGTVACLVAKVTGAETGYSIVIDEQNYLSPKGSTTDNIVSYVSVSTRSGEYRGAFGLTSVDYERPAVFIGATAVGESVGGFGQVGREYPVPLTISKKQLMAGQNHNYDHDPALTMLFPSLPTSCRIDVVGGFANNSPGVSIQLR